jgi:hypothetical protein
LTTQEGFEEVKRRLRQYNVAAQEAARIGDVG